MKCDRLLFKVLLLQSASGITKCHRLLLQSASRIRMCNSYYKMRRNKGERELAKWDIDYFDYKKMFSVCKP